ncbi:MAG: phosphatidylcholine/phosphatidylserine synthase, partial [Verrucomicrobia bacterium]|nr:phosphatidylcholine/phosphatidylserine synthase [Verrucomicrobiota bacterium]
VAPAVLVLKALAPEPTTTVSFFLMTAAVIYSISGILRLVRYTVTKPKLEADIEEVKKANAYFTGLPIPAGAMCAVSPILFLMSDDGLSIYATDYFERAVVAAATFVITGYFMISRWKFPSVKTLHIRVGSFQVVILTALVTAAILLLAVHHFALFLFAVSWGYLIASWALSMIRVASGKRLRALEDFDPEEDEDAPN